MAIILGLDFETDGLLPESNLPTELGMVLWDSDTHKPYSMISGLISNGAKLTPEITALTGILPNMLDRGGMPESYFLDRINKVVPQVDYFCAHNAQFDRGFLKAMYERNFSKMPDNKWIDTSQDIPYPETITTRKLVHLAAEHGFVNPFPHRALPDTLTMLTILSKYDFKEVERYALAPSIRIKAGVSYETKDQAKGRGYRYEEGTKSWFKNIKEFQLEEEIKKSPFKVYVES